MSASRLLHIGYTTVGVEPDRHTFHLIIEHHPSHSGLHILPTTFDTIGAAESRRQRMCKGGEYERGRDVPSHIRRAEVRRQQVGI